MSMAMQVVEIHGGRVEQGDPTRLTLPPATDGYSDAQIDDYHGLRRGRFAWRPGSMMSLRARFSHKEGDLLGTAGFGYWNAPFGDPGYRFPALPQAAWFFYASLQSNLPLASQGPANGWFVSTIDSSRPEALTLAPVSPFLVILNNIPRVRQRILPTLRRLLGISYQPLEVDLREWHSYRLEWSFESCSFWIDGILVHHSATSPRGPLGFVCWIDNQYLVATPTGRLRWGIVPTRQEQWLEVSELSLSLI